MAHIREGARVAYIGYGVGGLAVGDEGVVLALAGSGSHVRWATGAAMGRTSLVHNDDLVPQGVDPSEVAFETPLVSISVRKVFDTFGSVGVVNALAEEGHLTPLVDVVDESISMIAGRVREDPSVKEALGHLEPSEQAEVVATMVTALLREYTREDDA
jgi:hypothetical protein